MKFSTTSENTVLGGIIDRKDDGGTYECVVTDFFGTTVTAVANIIIECESNLSLE